MLARLIDQRPDFDPRAWMAQLPPMDLYGALLFQVTGQQLSRPGHPPDPGPRSRPCSAATCPRTRPNCWPSTPPSSARPGLSWRKAGTLRDLAERMTDGRLENQEELSTRPDGELMTELTAIPGIGPWTVQGALLIALGREDVVLPGDLALRKSIQAVYQLDHLPSQQEVLAVAENWRPYRSLATSYLFSAAFEPAEAPPVTPPET